MKLFCKIATMVLIVLFIFTGCSSTEDKYNAGLEAMNKEEWDAAIEYFSDIDYEDSKTLLDKCKKEKGMHENSDYDFLEAMSEAILKRYETSEKTDNIEKCVGIELEMIESYKDATFYDSALKELAVSYIEGVEIEKQSLSEDEGRQELKYYEGHAKRFETLKKLTDDYGLLSDNVDYKTNYYNKADKEIERYSAYKAIEEDLSKQFKEKENCDYVDDYTSRIKIKNNTSYDYDMLMHFTFYDSNGTVVKTNEIYYEDIKAGKNYNLDFYFPENANTFDYYTVEYINL